MGVPIEIGNPPLLQPRVRGCLSTRWEHWSRLGAEPWVVEVLRHGYRIPWVDSPPQLAVRPIPFPSYLPGSPKSLTLVRWFVRCWRWMRWRSSRTDLRPWSPVIDLSPLILSVRQTDFKMETVTSVTASIREGVFHDLRGSQGWVSPDTDPTRFTSIPPLRLGVTQGFAPGSADLRWSLVMIPHLGHDLSIVIDFGKSTLVSKIRAKFVVLISASVALRVSLQTPRFSDSWRYRNAS